MGVATVTLVGDDPSRAWDFLRLGAVVILAPDTATLRRWRDEGETVSTPGPHARSAAGRDDLHVDHPAHCVRWNGDPLPLTELEFRVLSCLGADPGHARSYRELRRVGWGECPDLGDDAYVVRAVVQRMRRKLSRAGVRMRIVAVRGFGLRLEAEMETA